jgi:hypothetical protein
MAKNGGATGGGVVGGRKGHHAGDLAQTEPPKSLSIAARGISTSRDFRDFMSALMSDVISGRVTANVTNAACNAGGKMLKMVDLECRYGTQPEQKRRTMSLAFEEPKQLESPE